MVKCKTKVWFNVKNTIINLILEVLSPNRCRRCGAWGENLCLCCKKYLEAINPGYLVCEKFGFEKIIVGGVKEGILSEILKEYKYKARRDLGGVLAWKVRRMLCEELKNDQNWKSRRVVLVPLPTARKHIRERGFDHIKYLAKSLMVGVEVDFLLERMNNKMQVGKDAKTRQEQAEGAYRVRDGCRLDKGVLYVLFDDVWTTGASMRAAQKVMREAGALNFMALVIMSNDYLDQ